VEGVALTSDIKRIENKLDIILEALGLSGKQKATPTQRREIVENDVLKFFDKKRKKHGHEHPQGS
jgi:hypothetical protein